MRTARASTRAVAEARSALSSATVRERASPLATASRAAAWAACGRDTRAGRHRVETARRMRTNGAGVVGLVLPVIDQ